MNNYYQIITQQYPKMLKNLAHFLEKGAHLADQKKFDFEVLMKSRLAPDQFPLVRQVQIACDVAKLTASRLAQKEAPIHEDKETTLADLQGRIASVCTYLASFKETDFAEASTRRISQPRWEGKTLSGDQYFAQWSMPNVYFHITTAYAILRHNGVDIGKKDYLGEMPFQ